MTSDDQTIWVKNLTANIACACSQRHTKDSVFWLVHIMLCIMTLLNFPPFVRPNAISDVLTNWLSIRQLLAQTISYNTTQELGVDPKICFGNKKVVCS